ncbi:CDP-alcohol phosphatidyltransferase family protein [Desulfurobacterium atlanticum]|uniref:CDP-diacylglycerol--glycerol-3-phosphate 3-phosphatidyltransferase n=1 Tax=Desulfurobacterium atlanticum TaxID=240169 RepID=A0A238YNR3_9BACT|nr:CDP-alcohol phosphatidyltransferase family protein [Desulfurobacterium atlanticum]SNR72906.1 CDP-diacylglycerol--glycerol-3-phosphate 3-phosphatidyltransferase [Desulfurobacterium atlanticum]
MISSSNLKVKVQKFFTPLAEAFDTIGITPDILTILGFFLSLITGVLIYKEMFFVAGIIFLFAGACDMLDGILARVKGRVTAAGAFMDSFFDRYADFFPLAGFVLFAFEKMDIVMAFLSLFSIVGSFATSYAKARAESLGVECKVGLLERPERFFIILFALFFGFVDYMLVVLAVLSNFTAFQRFFYVVSVLRKRG